MVLAAWLTLLLCFGAMVGGSVILSPEKLAEGGYALVPACPTKALLGRPCPTCGMSRAFASLGHGRVAEAIAYHPASPVVYSLMWMGAALGAVQTLRTLREMRRASARRNA